VASSAVFLDTRFKEILTPSFIFDMMMNYGENVTPPVTCTAPPNSGDGHGLTDLSKDGEEMKGSSQHEPRAAASEVCVNDANNELAGSDSADCAKPTTHISGAGSVEGQETENETGSDGSIGMYDSNYETRYGDDDDYVAGTFEGPEKTMEVQFRKGSGRVPGGLRSLSRAKLDAICKAARCTIMSQMSNNYCDAYVLSESSLFVYSSKLIMKTCGTTTLLRCIGAILSYADEMGMELTWLGYSRKNLFFPTAQQWPHSSFGDETKYLDTHPKLQNRLKGVGYILGPLTGDHWFVYVANHEPNVEDPVALPSPAPLEVRNRSPSEPIPCIRGSSALLPSPVISAALGVVPLSISTYVPKNNDRTINLMMFDMAPEVAAQFYLANTPGGGKEMTSISGISSLCPGATIDETHFAPCGYSMNGIAHDAYYTIHVTPEPECSYVSFETNAILTSYSALVRNVLRVFKPRRFLLTIFGDDEALEALKELPTDPRVIDMGEATYHRTSLASSSMDASSDADMMCYMANYKVDLATVKYELYDDEENAEIAHVPKTVPAPAFPHGRRQRLTPTQRLRGKSLGHD